MLYSRAPLADKIICPTCGRFASARYPANTRKGTEGCKDPLHDLADDLVHAYTRLVDGDPTVMAGMLARARAEQQEEMRRRNPFRAQKTKDITRIPRQEKKGSS